MLRIEDVFPVITGFLEEAVDGSDFCGRGIRGAVWALGGVAAKVPSQVIASFLFLAADINCRAPRTNEKRAHTVGRSSRCGPLSIQPNRLIREKVE